MVYIVRTFWLIQIHCYRRKLYRKISDLESLCSLSWGHCSRTNTDIECDWETTRCTRIRAIFCTFFHYEVVLLKLTCYTKDDETVHNWWQTTSLMLTITFNDKKKQTHTKKRRVEEPKEKHSAVASKEENHPRISQVTLLPWASPLLRQALCHNTFPVITI